MTQALSTDCLVHVHPFDLNSQQFIVIASNGLWDVMSPDKVVQFIWDYKCDQDQKHDQPQGMVGAIIKVDDGSHHALRPVAEKESYRLRSTKALSPPPPPPLPLCLSAC